MKKTTFKQCAAGDVFEHQGQALIKTTKPNTAVNLNSGAFAHFHDGSLVDRSDLVLIHQAAWKCMLCGLRVQVKMLLYLMDTAIVGRLLRVQRK